MTRRKAFNCFAGGCLLMSFVFMGCLFLPGLDANSISKAQEQTPVRKLTVDFVPEAGCPLTVTAARTELDLDPFGAPLDARTYVDYKNMSEKAITAVKFRIRFYDQEGKDRGTFHGPDVRNLEPGGQGSQKWKTERIDPRAAAVKMRALVVKFADGSVWESEKLAEIVQPPDSSSTRQNNTSESSAAGATTYSQGAGGSNGAPDSTPPAASAPSAAAGNNPPAAAPPAPAPKSPPDSASTPPVAAPDGNLPAASSPPAASPDNGHPRANTPSGDSGNTSSGEFPSGSSANSAGSLQTPAPGAGAGSSQPGSDPFGN